MDKREIFVIGGVAVMAVIIGIAIVIIKKKKQVLEMLMEIAKEENKISFKKFKEIVDELEKDNKVLEVLKKGNNDITEVNDDKKVKILSTDIIKILTDNKGIPYTNSNNNIDITLCNKVLIPYLRINALKKQIRSTAAIPVSISNHEHKQLLLDLWHHFNPNVPIQFPDTQWCKHILTLIYIYKVSLGFQGKDPTTDFRGSGYLGLLHLTSFSLHHPHSHLVFETATSPNTWYFYACTAINITSKVISYIDSYKCDEYFYNSNSLLTFDIIGMSQLLFNDAIVYFNNEIWLKEKHVNFMEVNMLMQSAFPAVLDKIYNNTFMNK